MSNTTRRHSTREVRKCVWQTLRKNFLPLMLALMLVSLPCLLAGWLEGTAEEYRVQVEQERADLLQMRAETPAEELPEEYHDMIMDAWVRESQMEFSASRMELISVLLRLVGWFLAMPLLTGVNRLLLQSVRGETTRWRDARLIGSKFRRSFSLQGYIVVMLMLVALPGSLICAAAALFSQALSASPAVCSIVTGIGMVSIAVMVFVQSLRYQLAPLLLAEGISGTASELTDKSLDILDRRSLRPMLSIIFPGLLMLAAAWALRVFVLRAFLAPAVAALLAELLKLPAWAYLLSGSAAIYTTFRTE